MLLHPKPVDAKLFTIVRDENPNVTLLVADASDVGPLGRVWDDACDVGLTVIGQTREIVFAENHLERDVEGELLFTDLIPADGQGSVPRVVVRLFND